MIQKRGKEESDVQRRGNRTKIDFVLVGKENRKYL